MDADDRLCPVVRRGCGAAARRVEPRQHALEEGEHLDVGTPRQRSERHLLADADGQADTQLQHRRERAVGDARHAAGGRSAQDAEVDAAAADERQHFDGERPAEVAAVGEAEVHEEVAVRVDLDHHDPDGHRHRAEVDAAERVGQPQLDPEHADVIADLLVEDLELQARQRAGALTAQPDGEAVQTGVVEDERQVQRVEEGRLEPDQPLAVGRELELRHLADGVAVGLDRLHVRAQPCDRVPDRVGVASAQHHALPDAEVAEVEQRLPLAGDRGRRPAEQIPRQRSLGRVVLPEEAAGEDHLDRRAAVRLPLPAHTDGVRGHHPEVRRRRVRELHRRLGRVDRQHERRKVDPGQDVPGRVERDLHRRRREPDQVLDDLAEGHAAEPDGDDLVVVLSSPRGGSGDPQVAELDLQQIGELLGGEVHAGRDRELVHREGARHRAAHAALRVAGDRDAGADGEVPWLTEDDGPPDTDHRPGEVVGSRRGREVERQLGERDRGQLVVGCLAHELPHQRDQVELVPRPQLGLELPRGRRRVGRPDRERRVAAAGGPDAGQHERRDDAAGDTALERIDLEEHVAEPDLHVTDPDGEVGRDEGGTGEGLRLQVGFELELRDVERIRERHAEQPAERLVERDLALRERPRDDELGEGGRHVEREHRLLRIREGGRPGGTADRDAWPSRGERTAVEVALADLERAEHRPRHARCAVAPQREPAHAHVAHGEVGHRRRPAFRRPQHDRDVVQRRKAARG